MPDPVPPPARRPRWRALLWWWLVPLLLVAALFGLLAWAGASDQGTLHIYGRP